KNLLSSKRNTLYISYDDIHVYNDGSASNKWLTHTQAHVRRTWRTHTNGVHFGNGPHCQAGLRVTWAHSAVCGHLFQCAHFLVWLYKHV
ncbi:unnamed protein product, partial [Ixodes persulcatus]